jgi:UDP:flavonoid glycosyltransferase YjiC (YdhE family)
MRAGKPMLVVPFSHDQPDNAARLERLGVARRLMRRRFSTTRAVPELRPLLENSSYAKQAERMGSEVRRENGPANAANVVEAVIETEAPNALK